MFKFILATCLITSFNIWAKAEIGKPAPQFKLNGHDGKTYDLAAMKGQWVVLEWFNDECPYVDKHYHESARNMQELQKKWQEAGKSKGGLNWFAVNSSAPGKQGHLTNATAKQIVEVKRKAHMKAILLDADGAVGKAYDAKTTPHMFIISPEGLLAYNGAIDDKDSTRIESLKGAQNYVTAALTSLFDNKAIAQPVTKPYGCSVKY
jgi:peroxiredoxin